MKKPVIVVVGLFIASALAALSCGSSSKGGTIPQDQACTQASPAACTKVCSCRGAPSLTAAQGGLGGTEPACETMIQMNFCAPFLCSAADYHGDKAQQCKDQFGSVSCAQLSAAALAGGLRGGGAPAAVRA